MALHRNRSDGQTKFRRRRVRIADPDWQSVDFGTLSVQSDRKQTAVRLIPRFGKYPDIEAISLNSKRPGVALEADILYPCADSGPLTVRNWMTGAAPRWDLASLHMAGIVGPCAMMFALSIAATQPITTVDLVVSVLLLSSGCFLSRAGQVAQMRSLRSSSERVQSRLWDRILRQSPNWFRTGRRQLPVWTWQAAFAAQGRVSARRTLLGEGVILAVAAGLVLAFENTIAIDLFALSVGTAGVSCHGLSGRIARMRASAQRHRSVAEKAMALCLNTIVAHRLLGAADFLSARARRLNDRARTFEARLRRAEILVTTIGRLSLVIAPATLLLVSPDAGISSILIGLIASVSATSAAWTIASLTGMRRFQFKQMQRLLRQLEVPPPDGIDVGPVHRIEVRDLNFAFAGSDATLLTAVDLVAETGDVIAIAGPSGVGKSTLLRLMTGLIEPRSGDVLVNGRPLDLIDGDAFRRRIGAVFQENPDRFSTIRTAIGDHEIALPDIERAAHLAGAASAIEALPMGYQTLILEGAIASTLVQQIRIARAVVRSPDVVILDEAMSHLDPKDAHRLIAELKARGAITFFCSHNPAILALADRTIHLGPLDATGSVQRKERALAAQPRTDVGPREIQIDRKSILTEEVFRPAAIERLASPDQLDEAAAIRASGLWCMLTGVVLASVAIGLLVLTSVDGVPTPATDAVSPPLSPLNCGEGVHQC